MHTTDERMPAGLSAPSAGDGVPGRTSSAGVAARGRNLDVSDRASGVPATAVVPGLVGADRADLYTLTLTPAEMMAVREGLAHVMLDADHDAGLAELAAGLRERIIAAERPGACELTLTAVSAGRATVWVGRCGCAGWERVDESASTVSDWWIGHRRGEPVWS